MRPFALLLIVACTGWISTAFGEVKSDYLLPAVPVNFNLQSCDDCGELARQPHIQAADCGVHTFTTGEVNAPEKVRSVSCGLSKITARYTGLDAKQPYVVAVTYANEAFNHRVQSLWAGGVQLQAAHPLPKGGFERLCFTIPEPAIKDGVLDLEFRKEADVNVVVSVIELYSPAPSPKKLYVEQVSALNEDLRGVVLDLDYEPAVDTQVEVTRADGGASLSKVVVDKAGAFTVNRAALGTGGKFTDIKVIATRNDVRAELAIPRSAIVFDPIHYRPIPARVGGLTENQIKLDGTWRIRTQTPEAARQQPLDAADWGKFKVPGQWLQQGYDVPMNQPVAVAEEFTVPAAWKGYRVFLRFDSIHAGTQYWVNGHELGHSENLYTPVDWEITDAVKVGAANRLDLLMTVQTTSEALSYSSGYAFHNLGGIDRSVWIYALPPAHIRSLRVLTDLDKDYRDGQAKLDISLDGQGAGLELAAAVTDEKGGEIARATASVTAAAGPLHLELTAKDPKKWSDEKPNLYSLTLELKRGSDVLERVERQIGFRKIEIRGRQLYVNNRRVKLAGGCRHETDPLTGRADTMHLAEGDIQLMKAANLNYVRTSHYPPPHELLDAADRVGLYVEVEAPFCWVGDQWDMQQAVEVLTPTSAMVDYLHTHPSILVWSLANESAFRPFFKTSNRLIKELDPTRPTTFNNPDPDQVCDIVNVHYPAMPYADSAKNDPRPLFLGEYFFPVCHEQTDVRIDPGLRELWGAGHSDPTTAYAQACAKVFDHPPGAIPGGAPGSWTYMYNSDVLIGGAIWATFDEPFYLPGNKHAGYYWVHGPWGLIDAWRRPKPEWWLSKLLFSPVWFPSRQAEWSPGQKTIKVFVENRYAFTNLNELILTSAFADHQEPIKAELAPGASGTLEIPVPAGAKATDALIIRVTDASGRLVNAVPIALGPRPHAEVPQPIAGAPDVEEHDGQAVIRGTNFTLVLNEKSGELIPADARYLSALRSLPCLHLTRYDWGDFIREAPRYAVLPDEKTRQVESVRVEKQPTSVLIEIHDRYALFTGMLRWIIDRNGVCAVTTDYVYTGPDMQAREVGIRMALDADCQTLQWRRWSEWGDVYPEDSISRTVGTANAHRDAKWPLVAESVRPSWPWSQDENEFGTADFRGVKLNIYEAALTNPSGRGVKVHADADAHVVCRLAEKSVLLHALSDCRLGPVTIKNGDHVGGTFHLRLLGTESR